MPPYPPPAATDKTNEVHFVGTLQATSNVPAPAVSVTWAIVPGNTAWSVLGGYAHGETQICETKGGGTTILDHPIDVHYDCSTTEGWPVIVFEIWDRSTEGLRGFCGCGSIWLPSSPGQHRLDTAIWRPVTFDDGIIPDEDFLPCIPDLTALRQYIIKPNTRSRVQSKTVGDLRLEIYTVCSDFESHGVALS